MKLTQSIEQAQLKKATLIACTQLEKLESFLQVCNDIHPYNDCKHKKEKIMFQ